MKIVSWNVNGLRSVLEKDFRAQMQQLDADVICLQEIKSDRQQLQRPVLDGYDEHWNSSTVKKGYSGTLTLCRTAPRFVKAGLEGTAASGEGRVLMVEYEDFYLLNVYAPNTQDKLKRLPERRAWNTALLAYLKQLEASRPVVLCGDMNVAHEDIDLAHPSRHRGKKGFSFEERDDFNALLNAGYIDAFRYFTHEPDHYTFWRFNKGTREKNMGWRIDYFCVSDQLEAYIARENQRWYSTARSDHHLPPLRLLLADVVSPLSMRR